MMFCSGVSRLYWRCFVLGFPGCTDDVSFEIFQVVLVMFCSGVSRFYW